MKVLAKFLGRLIAYTPSPEPSYVTLKNLETGEYVETDAVSEKLLEQGITTPGCEFEVVVVEEDGKTTAKMTKLEPKILSDAELEAISKEVDGKLTTAPPVEQTPEEKQRIAELEQRIKELEAMLGKKS